MFISIVIPTYNRPDFLSACLQPLASQTRGDPDVEVIVVDDGSKTEIAHKNRDLCSLYNVKYCGDDKNRGMAVARNRGIAQANGRWVVFLDDDFRVAGDWYATLKPLLAAQPEDVVGIEGKVEPSGNGLWDREVQNLNGGLYITCHIAFRKKLLDTIGGFDQQFQFEGPFCEDHELAVRALRQGEIRFAPHLTGHHLPRRMRQFRYTMNSFWRVFRLMRAEHYFFCKQNDWYHRFRHSRTFWGTYLSMLFRNVYNNLRRRNITDLFRHPLQLSVLLASSVFEQISAWLLIPHFIARMLQSKPVYFHNHINERQTALAWQLADPSLAVSLRFSLSPVRSALFPVLKKPVYRMKPVLQRMRNGYSFPTCQFLLRIDDVFLRDTAIVRRFVETMSRKKYPYCCGVTGNDLLVPANLPIIDLLRESGAEIAIHGFSHGGNFGPFPSEILQMSYPQLDRKLSEVAGSEVFKTERARIFMPPYNTVAAEQIIHLGRQFDIITGGPETARFTDRFMGPVALKNSGWYIPIALAYVRNARAILQHNIISKAQRLRGMFCICFHMTEEAKNDFASLASFLDALPRPCMSWRLFTKDSTGEALFCGERKES